MVNVIENILNNEQRKQAIEEQERAAREAEAEKLRKEVSTTGHQNLANYNRFFLKSVYSNRYFVLFRPKSRKVRKNNSASRPKQKGRNSDLLQRLICPLLEYCTRVHIQVHVHLLVNSCITLLRLLIIILIVHTYTYTYNLYNILSLCY